MSGSPFNDKLKGINKLIKNLRSKLDGSEYSLIHRPCESIVLEKENHTCKNKGSLKKISMEIEELSETVNTLNEFDRSCILNNYKDTVKKLKSSVEERIFNDFIKGSILSKKEEEINKIKDSYKAINEKNKEYKRENRILRSNIREITQNLDLLRNTNTNLVDNPKLIENNNNNNLIENNNNLLNNNLIEKLNLKLEELNLKLNNKNQALEDRNLEILNLNKELNKNLQEIEKLKSNDYKLRERISELEGNIRVFIRIRKKSVDKKQSLFSIKNNEICLPKTGIKFEYDRILPASIDQEALFSDLVFLIESIFNGYSLLLGCYGQTGSGKTFTMEGEFNSKNAGILPRALNLIFNKIEKLKKNNTKVSIKFASIEIYNDKIFDFLSTPSKNFNYVEVESKEEIIKYYFDSVKKRRVGATKCNSESSRSHFLNFISIKTVSDDEIRRGEVVFVDLAGSERLKRSQVENERLDEMKKINSSLLSLRNVIFALKERSKHIPYRNCKLTYVLKPLIEKQMRLLLIVNITDAEEDYDETLCSLRFGELSKSTKIGRTQQNMELNL